jgi:transcriptional regulator with XRE-family HTH domain
MKNIGQQLKEARELKKLTLQEVAEEVFGNKNFAIHISEIERGLSPGVTFVKINKLLEFFKIDLVDLLKEKNAMIRENMISIEEIQETDVYKKLGEVDPKHPHLNNKINQTLLLKRQSRELITHGLNVWKNTNKIPANITGYQLKVVNELIEKLKNNSDV